MNSVGARFTCPFVGATRIPLSIVVVLPAVGSVAHVCAVANFFPPVSDSNSFDCCSFLSFSLYLFSLLPFLKRL